MKYYPFGESRNSQGNVATDRLFTGQRLDSTGLYYYGARYYDPQIGRFISADSIVPEWKNPQSLNRYSYTHNNPLKYTDPSGHLTISVSWSLSFHYYYFHYDVSVANNYDNWNMGHTQTKSEPTGLGEKSNGLRVAFTGALEITNARTVHDLGNEVRAVVDVIELVGAGYESIHGKSGQTDKFYQGSAVKIGFGHSIGSYFKTVESSPLFTATSTQLYWLNLLASDSYCEKAIDYAYNNVASGLGQGQMVGWTSELGYHAVDASSNSYSYPNYYWY